MRSKNSRKIDSDEAAYLADVKRVPCVFDNKPGPGEAHHPFQGLHYLTVAACHDCHVAEAWRIGHPNEIEAINETQRRVAEYRRKGSVTVPLTTAIRKGRRADLSSSKIVPRKP